MTIESSDPHSGSPNDGHTADPVEPAPGASTALDWDSDENPYRKRFEDYRRTADQKVTRLSQYEQAVQDFQSGDPDEMRRAAAILGIADSLEIEEPEPPTYDDPAEELRAQLEAQRQEFEQFKSELTAKEQKQLEEQGNREVRDRLDALKLDAEDRNVVLGLALTRDFGEDGLPDVKAAYDALVARDRQRDRDWRDGKRAAPASIAPGSTATQQKKPTDMLNPDGSLNQEGLDYYAQIAEDRS